MESLEVVIERMKKQIQEEGGHFQRQMEQMEQLKKRKALDHFSIVFSMRSMLIQIDKTLATQGDPSIATERFCPNSFDHGKTLLLGERCI